MVDWLVVVLFGVFLGFFLRFSIVPELFCSLAQGEGDHPKGILAKSMAGGEFELRSDGKLRFQQEQIWSGTSGSRVQDAPWKGSAQAQAPGLLETGFASSCKV